MVNKISFQFSDDLDYQLKAINSVVALFKGLPRQVDTIHRKRIAQIDENDPIRNTSIVTGTKLLKNLNSVQFDSKLFADNEVLGNNFTIEMETGTGKTYVYLRTILELYKEYDFKKFIIVVPSIAIRKGIEKSIEQLQDHFKRLYNIDIEKHSFIYDSSNTSNISSKLVESNTLSICVMNIQAFNKDTNKIRTDDEYGKILWDDIKYIKPIVIIDEPQKIEGQKGKKSKSLQAIDEIEPLFTLRYSATHKNLYNQIYRLNSFDAYKKDLVKRIKVKTVNGVIEKDFPYVRYISFTKDLKARIEIFSQEQGGKIRFKNFDVFANTSLEELSGGLVQYKNMRILEEPHKLHALKISAPEGDFELAITTNNSGLEDSEAVRIQIRLAIKSHFEKQFSILDTGKEIKGITLFFIDAVHKVRDSTREDNRGEYLRIFDEEYSSYIKTQEARFKKYENYFPCYKDVLQVREGYFAIDKTKHAVEIEDWDASKDDMSVKAKSQEDIDRGIELILEKKDELISFNEPLSFIFSHSALREGWDNPNVFTLCTLKKGSSDIAKKQEVGRGLRLPVDITGNRCLDIDINELTVIANDSYENFSKSLQDDFNEQMNFKKNEVTADILQNALENAGLLVVKITSELVTIFKQELVDSGIIDKDSMLIKNAEQTTQLLNDLVFDNPTLEEHRKKITEEFISLMQQRGSNKITIENGDNESYTNSVRAFVSEDEFKKLYTNLCENLTKRTLYKCKIDSQQFIKDCITDINSFLQNFSAVKKVNTTESEAGFNKAQMFEVKKIDEVVADIEVGMECIQKSDFEIANYIMYHTNLPRLAIFKILQGIEKKEIASFVEILDKVTQRILEKLTDAKAKNIISYEVIEGYNLDEKEIFGMDTINEEDFTIHWKIFKSDANKKKAINEYYKMDSEGERKFAQRLEGNDNVVLFTKLKKGGFVIDTPYGNYSPDWAIIYKNPKNHTINLYFIVETKADKKEANLSDVEKYKIECGKLHFKAVSDLVQFDWVNGYEDFKVKFNVVDTV